MGLFRPHYRLHLTHCFLLIIPALLFITPHWPVDSISHTRTGAETVLRFIELSQAKEGALNFGQPKVVPTRMKVNREKSETGLPGLNVPEKKITISDDLFGMWYSELYLHMEQYEGYTIVVTGYVLKDPEVYKNDEFAAARLAMTCCEADLTPVGMMCNYPGALDLKEDSWVTAEGTLVSNYEEYDGRKYANPLIMVSHITPAEAVEGYVYPY